MTGSTTEHGQQCRDGHCRGPGPQGAVNPAGRDEQARERGTGRAAGDLRRRQMQYGPARRVDLDQQPCLQWQCEQP